MEDKRKFRDEDHPEDVALLSVAQKAALFTSKMVIDESFQNETKVDHLIITENYSKK